MNVRAHDGTTALLWAAHWNDLDTADLLIRAGADVNAANDLRMTPLSLRVHEREVPRWSSVLLAGRRQSQHGDRDRRNADHDVRQYRQCRCASAC